jgi:hypothetical protein
MSMSPQELQFWETLAVLILLGGIIYVVWKIGRHLYVVCGWLHGIVLQLGEINQTLKLYTHRDDLERIEREIAARERRREEEHQVNLQAYAPQSPPTPTTPSSATTAITSPAAMSRAFVLGREAAMMWRWFKRGRR